MNILALALLVSAQDGNRLVPLDESDPYYVHRSFPKLTTPQWVGEDGVEAVVVLAIDDMRGHEKWEAYLRPILERLKKIDGRAPVSIMTCTIDPNHPHLRRWLSEGLNLDVHTVDHPCPLLQGNDFAKAKSTVDRCIDLLNLVPGNRPTAYRMPCCDSLNTPSPRFYAEIFNRTTPNGKFLTIDTSVFCVLTPEDPELPRDLVLDADGKEKFRKYIPFPSFVNTIENYPYPYVIGKLCWQFPCIVPSDWEAQHLNKPNHPLTVADLKAALDGVVAKRGVFNLVFHPHGWIKAEQVNELIDHAVAKHGRKVKFLNFAEAQERIDRHLLAGHPLRRPDGGDNGVRLLDANADGFLDVVVANRTAAFTRIWDDASRSWKERSFPAINDHQMLAFPTGYRFGIQKGVPGIFAFGGARVGAWRFDGDRWRADPGLLSGVAGLSTTADGKDRGVRFRDLDGDGGVELVVGNEAQREVYAWETDRWEKLPFALPHALVDEQGRDRGLRFVDLNGDGRDDLVFSDEREWSVHVWKDLAAGWEQLSGGKAGEPAALPMIVRSGTDNGAWFHSKHLWVQNEDTAKMPNLVDRRSFEHLLQPR
jgi:hypothetical protein